MMATQADARSFDHRAEHFDRFAELVGGPLDEFIDSQIPHGGGGRAVDLGCGTGRHAALLANRYQHVVAVDVSTQMLDVAKARRGLPNIAYQHRDLGGVRADTDGTFDLVLSAYALHHVDDLDPTLEGIRELVAPGGRAILIDNVDPRGRVSRRRLWKEAIHILAGDLIKRRRSSEEAWELFGLNTDPDWLRHLISDRFPTPEQFTQRYGAVFPGAAFTELYRARALCWTCPTGTPAGQARRERSAPTPRGEPTSGEQAGNPA
jgi:SAM-dependent methyltransferase